MNIDENEIKIDNFKNLIRKTILAIQKYKNLDIILAGELNSTLEFLNNLFKMVSTLDISQSNIKENLDDIESQLINLVKNYEKPEEDAWSDDYWGVWPIDKKEKIIHRPLKIPTTHKTLQPWHKVLELLFLLTDLLLHLRKRLLSKLTAIRRIGFLLMPVVRLLGVLVGLALVIQPYIVLLLIT